MSAMLRCPKCQTVNKEGARFCKACGIEIPQVEAKLRCPNGHIMEEMWDACPWCGKPAVGSAEASPSTARNPTVPEKRCPEGHPMESGQSVCGICGPKAAGEKGSMAFHNEPVPARRKTLPEKAVLARGGGQDPGAPQATASDVRKVLNREEVPEIQAAHPVHERRPTIVIRSESGEAAEGVAKPRLVGFLVSYTMDPAGKAFEIREGRHVIGSGGQSTIRVDLDTAMSREHAILLHRRGRFLFQDNLSTNGSFIDGEAVDGQIELKHGSLIEMGSTGFILVTVSQQG